VEGENISTRTASGTNIRGRIRNLGCVERKLLVGKKKKEQTGVEEKEPWVKGSRMWGVRTPM